ncbi:MAG: hypothetical protein HZA53_15550 [Planctomycetes bacterium]|nr:hypothetical protein [Planctomycetota bacterium]
MKPLSKHRPAAGWLALGLLALPLATLPLGAARRSPLVPTLLTHELFGRWEDDASSQSIEFFVAPGGGGAGTPNNPFGSITQALSLVSLILDDPGAGGTGATPPIRITLNIAPAIYGSATGEVFPLRLPAHGVSIETWKNDPAAVRDRPWIVGTFLSNAIEVDWVGNPTQPASVIQTLEITNANFGIRIAPGVLGAPTPTPIEVEVRQCFLHDCATPLRIETGGGFVTRHVIEDNDIGDDEPVQNFAVRETCGGVASTLYRSNRIQMYEEGVNVSGNGATCAPRIFSNFVQRCERTVTLTNCDSHVINNTIAFATDFTFVPQVSGVSIIGGTFELDNNLLWCPLPPSQVPAIDLSITGGAVGSQVANRIEDVAALPAPLLVGGDAHLGLLPTDLHLSPPSPLIGAGSLVEAGLALRSLMVGPLLVRTDVSMDVDTDARFYASASEGLPTVDIGGDEFHDLTPLGMPMVRIDYPVTPTQDRFGNVTAQPGLVFPNPSTRQWNADLGLTGPSNGFWVLFLGYGFEDLALDPALGAMVENGTIYQNTPLPQLGLGNALIDLSPAGQITALSGTFDALGAATAANVRFAIAPEASQEAEWHLQMLTLDPATGRLAVSNRVKMELNERP